MNIKILVATHKPYKMPGDNMYIPLQVGAEGKKDLGFQRDNEGENISESNPRFCELTGTYWAWKNICADYIGLVHYRRHFTAYSFLKRIFREKFSIVLSTNQLSELLKTSDLILPTKRRYYIETIYSHFVHLPYTYEKDIQVLGQVIHELTPEYDESYLTVMNRTWAHMFNMFVMKKEYFDKYCQWMFPILFEVDKRIDTSSYTAIEKRAVAYLAEFMMDIWLDINRISVKEVNVIFMEYQNWLIKGGKFIQRKIFGQQSL